MDVLPLLLSFGSLSIQGIVNGGSRDTVHRSSLYFLFATISMCYESCGIELSKKDMEIVQAWYLELDVVPGKSAFKEQKPGYAKTSTSEH